MDAVGLVRSAGAAIARARSGAPPAGERLPLPVLRLPTGSRAISADWKLEPDGVLGRALEVSAGPVVSFPLRLDGEVTFTATARLYPHDWRDSVGAVRAVLSAQTPGGVRELWAATLSAGDRGRPGGVPVRVTLPSGTTALRFAVLQPRTPAGDDPVERMIWVEPALWDPAGTPAPRTEDRSVDAAASPPSAAGPLFSVLVPVHDPPLHMLREAIESVGGQTFAAWELCIVDDGSHDPAVIDALEGYTADPRIRVHRHDTARGISAATNAALELATGDYIALLDHDDTLAPDALERIADTIAADPALDMIYSDEDIVSGGVVIEPHPKPGWSPDHLDALMYTCHLGVYRRTLAEELGGFDRRFDGCQDFDFVLRLAERTDRIAHVPGNLYHWRAHPGSTATLGGGAKPHAFLAQPPAIAAHLARIGVAADVVPGHLPGVHRIVHRHDPGASIAIALSLESAEGLAVATGSWARQAHRSWRLVLAAPAGAHAEIARALERAGIGRDRVELLQADAGGGAAAGGSAAGLARAVAAAAQLADHVLMLQTPAAGLTHDWLTRLIGYAARAEIAAAGPVVIGRAGTIAQAGVALPEGLPLHLQHDFPAGSAAPAAMNVSAVSGALLARSDVVRESGGLDAEFGELALVEWCLRATDPGRRIVLVPDARLRITGPDPTMNDLPALWALRARWAERRTEDRYFNAGYLTDRGDLALRPA